MRQMLALLSSALFLFSAHVGAVVVTLDPKSVTITDFGETGIGLMSGKSVEPLIHFAVVDRFYVQSALASALSLETCLKIDTTSHQLFVGFDAQSIEDGWLIDARFVRKEREFFVFRKAHREVSLDGLKVELEQHFGKPGFFAVGVDETQLIAEYFPFDQFVLSATDQNADGKPTIRMRGFESKHFREVGKDLNWQVLRRGSRLGSVDVMPTIMNGPAARLRNLEQSGTLVDQEHQARRFQSGTILLSQPNEKTDLGKVLAKWKRNADGQGHMVLVPLQLNGKWALLKVLKESQTLFVDWSGQSTEAHLAQFLPGNNNLTVRRVETLRPPKRGEEESEPMFEKLEELLKEQVSPRALISPRTTVEVLQQAVAVAFGVDKAE